ncbi:MAG: hypothetical protein OER04_05075 [Cyclobacteriaceae bacterium]|nr:hypothetical protein [Cyclobacteriaceae bacterium]
MKKFLWMLRDNLRPYNLPAEANLNREGLLLKKGEEPRWIMIEPPKNKVRSIIGSPDLQDIEKPKANYHCSINGYLHCKLVRRLSPAKTL